MTVQTDSSLAETVSGSEAFQKTIRLLDRAEAEKLFDYQGTWPPPEEDLRAVDLAGADYIVAGSLTQLGQLRSIDLKVYDLADPSAPTFFFIEVSDPAKLNEGLNSLVGQVLTHVGKEFLIASITPQGNARIDSGAIRHQIKSKKGDVYEPSRLQQDLKNVFKMGYFDDVRIKVADSKDGKQVIFEVTEKPLIGQVLLKGTDELKEDKVRGAISINANTIVNPNKIKEAAANIKSLYKEEGFYNTEVTTELTELKKDRVDVIFNIVEGQKIYTKEVRFAGNKSFTPRQLKKMIQTSEKGMLSWLTDSGVLKKEVLEYDVARLTAFYHNKGYIKARVGEPEVVQEGKWLYVTFNIFEGDRYRVGSIDLAGDLIEEEAILLNTLKLKNEEYLSRSILREDILGLTDYYSEKGYAYAEVSPSVTENDAEKRVDIVFNIDKGILVNIERIAISGNTRTRDKVIRRQLEVHEGEVFNSKALRESHDRLQALDFFEDINITPEQTEDPAKMDMSVKVKEKPTGSFSVGAGYSSIENLMFMAEISQNNFLGRGQRLSLNANVSSSQTKFNLGFTEPRIADTKLMGSINLYNWESDYDDYSKESYGGSINFGYPIWRKWVLGFGYGYDDADLTNVSPTASQIIRESMDIHVTSYTNWSLSRRTVDKAIDPGKGSVNSIGLTYAGGPLGGDSAYTKTELVSNWYFPIFWKTTFHVKGSAGQVSSQKDGKLPVFEKYYLGGINNIRGFSSGRISPQDPATKERIGGRKMWYTNTEWIFPLVADAGLKGVVFFDAGNVYDNGWEMDKIKKSVGGGFRWISPMGPLRLEWGYVIDPDPDDETNNWDFSIGGSF